jgi:hypothetical protein
MLDLGVFSCDTTAAPHHSRRAAGRHSGAASCHLCFDLAPASWRYRRAAATKKRARRFREKASSNNTVDSVTVLEDSDEPDRKLKDILVAYLLAANYPPWPGADGLVVDDALSTYLQASAEGLVPGPAELRSRHPELAEHLHHFFAPNLVMEKSEI